MANLGFQSYSTRAAILISFWLAILLSIPSWLKTTTIERLPLPAFEVQKLEDVGDCPVLFQAKLRVLVDPTLVAGTDKHLFLTQVQELIRDSLQIKDQLEVGTSLECMVWDIKASEDAQAIESDNTFDPNVLDLTIRALPSNTTTTTTTTTTATSDSSSNRCDWIPIALVPETESSAQMVPDTVSAAVVAELLKLRGDKAISSSDATETRTAVEQDPRIIQYSKHVRLVFSIMNQDIASGSAYDSSLIHGLDQLFLGQSNQVPNPIKNLVEELKGLHNFHIESQVQWVAPLHFTPTQEILEEVVEYEVDQEVMVDEEVDVDVEVEADDDDEEEKEASPVPDSATDEEAQEAAEVDSQPASKPKRPKTVKQKQIRQVPKLEKVKKRSVTTLPPRYVVEWDDLKVFVNSAEWSLISTVPPPATSVQEAFASNASSAAGVGADGSKLMDASSSRTSKFDLMSQTHDLHFLLYVPSRDHAPLLIRGPDGNLSDASAWLIPQWGGVVILNPPVKSTEQDQALVSSHPSSASMSASQSGVCELPQHQVQEAIDLFARQIQILLGLGSDTFSLAPSSSFQQEESQNEAELELVRKLRLQTLLQRRILEVARETVSTLGGIVRLVRKIQNLGVGQDVQKDVRDALRIMQNLAPPDSTNLTITTPKESLISQPGIPDQQNLTTLLTQLQTAYALASRAFFNPDMLALLYFPDEHKYAVYTPLFGPLLVPLIVTTIKMIKEGFKSSSSSSVTKTSRRLSSRRSL